MIYDNYSAPFFGPDYRVLRGGSWATGAAAVRTSLPQLGPADPPPDLQRPAARLGRLMCRHVAWLGAPRTLRRCSRAGVRAAAPVVCAAAAAARADERRRLGRRLVDARASPTRLDGVPPARSGATSPSPPWPPTCRQGVILAAVRSATVGMPQDETAAAPFSATAGCCRTTAGSIAACCPTRPGRAAESVCDSAVLASWLLEAPARDRRARRRSRRRATRPHGSMSSPATASSIVATTWGDTLSVLVSSDGRGHRQRALRRRSGLARRSPTAACSPRPLTGWRSPTLGEA